MTVKTTISKKVAGIAAGNDARALVRGLKGVNPGSDAIMDASIEAAFDRGFRGPGEISDYYTSVFQREAEREFRRHPTVRGQSQSAWVRGLQRKFR